MLFTSVVVVWIVCDAMLTDDSPVNLSFSYTRNSNSVHTSPYNNDKTTWIDIDIKHRRNNQVFPTRTSRRSLDVQNNTLSMVRFTAPPLYFPKRHNTRITDSSVNILSVILPPSSRKIVCTGQATPTEAEFNALAQVLGVTNVCLYSFTSFTPSFLPSPPLPLFHLSP